MSGVTDLATDPFEHGPYDLLRLMTPIRRTLAGNRKAPQGKSPAPCLEKLWSN